MLSHSFSDHCLQYSGGHKIGHKLSAPKKNSLLLRFWLWVICTNANGISDVRFRGLAQFLYIFFRFLHYPYFNLFLSFILYPIELHSTQIVSIALSISLVTSLSICGPTHWSLLVVSGPCMYLSWSICLGQLKEERRNKILIYARLLLVFLFCLLSYIRNYIIWVDFGIWNYFWNSSTAMSSFQYLLIIM